MTLVQLVYFVRVVELQSLSKAASVVRIAQPAISRQIRALEIELGATLLVRHGWGVTATPAGAVFADQARQILKAADAARHAVRAMAAEPSGQVSLSVPSSIALALLPHLSTTLSERYPAVRQHFMDSFTSITPGRIFSGELDLAIMNHSMALEPLVSTPLLSEDLVLVGAPGQEPVAAASSSKVLRDTALIVPSRPHPLRLLVDRATRGATRNIVVELDSLPTILQMLRLGQGFSVLPFHCVADEVGRGELAVHALVEPRLSRTLSIVRPPGPNLTLAVAVVEAEIREIVRSSADFRRWRPL